MHGAKARTVTAHLLLAQSPFLSQYVATRRQLLLTESGAQTNPAFTTPIGQNCTSGSGGFSGSKTVSSSSFYFTWLVCTFHDVVLARTVKASPGQLSGPEKFKAGDSNRVSRPGQSLKRCYANKAARKFVWKDDDQSTNIVGRQKTAQRTFRSDRRFG